MMTREWCGESMFPAIEETRGQAIEAPTRMHFLMPVRICRTLSLRKNESRGFVDFRGLYHN